MSLTVDSVIWSKMYIWTLKMHSDPKTRKYWADVVNDMVLFNPEFILSQLENAKSKIAKVKAEGWEILIVADKILFRDEIADICESEWIHYMNYKVPAWVFTNFTTLKSRIDSMLELERYVESDDFMTLTKKERQDKMKQLKKLKSVYNWVRNLKNKPDLAIILDWVGLSNFVDEIDSLWLDNIVVASSNFNRYWKEENLLLSNLSSYESIKFAMEYILKK